MSWIDDIIDFGSSVVNFVSNNPIGGALARTAISYFTLNQVTESINRDNQTTAEQKPDPGVREQVNPDPNAKIPVVYGDAVIGGIVTDAVMTNGNQTMFYCMTLCEKTGNLGLGSGAASAISYLKIFRNNELLKFQSDGITVASGIDLSGTENTDLASKIQVWCYNGGSTSGIQPQGYTGSTPAAYSVMPTWTSNHTMNNLVFVIIRIDYSREKNVTSLGDWKFKLSNTMRLPGDCLYDYMTNTRYGAGISAGEISVS